MNLKQALAAFPAESVYRTILPDLLATEESTWDKAYDRLHKLGHVANGEDPMATTWKLSEAEALALLRAAVSLPFPPVKHRWRNAVHDLLFTLVRSPYPSLLTIAYAAYPQLTERAKSAILTLLGAIGTREAAEGFMTILRAHGWPAELYPRVFIELQKLLDYPTLLFPELLQLAGKQIGAVTDLLLTGLALKKVDLAAGQLDLEAIAPLAGQQLSKALKKVRRFQRAEGIAWRFSEKYFEPRREAESWLDLAGYLKAEALDEPFQQALELRDPRLLAFASASLLRRGAKVSKRILSGIAACHETRALLFELLKQLNRLELFPVEWRIWDAFAAANMVDWLLYPTELGREPDTLQKKAVYMSRCGEEVLTIYIWRFRTANKPWYAGVSGPYQCQGEPQPLHGNLTFSRFDEWGSATVEEHLAAAVDTLAEWKRAGV